jgi:hypothetical protein
MTNQYVGVVDGRVVEDYGEQLGQSWQTGQAVCDATGRLQARYGMSAEVAIVDADRPLVVGDEVEVDDDGVATVRLERLADVDDEPDECWYLADDDPAYWDRVS